MNWPSHGSNPHYIYETMNIHKPDTLIDLSANINPLGPPAILREKWLELYDQIQDYPDPNGNSLKQLIAQKEGVTKECILLGNGGAELISLVGRMLARKNVLIIQPAFSEYEKACKANGCQVEYYHMDRDWSLDLEGIITKLAGLDAVFLCNPNNPTGIYFPYQTVLQMAEECRKRGTYLIIDEAFYDFIENYEPLIPLLKKYSNVLILRSMTKMFAIPGLRLGYMLANQEVIENIAHFQPHWSVNALALVAGELCIKEDKFLQKTRTYIQNERDTLFSFFQRQSFQVSPSKTNFYLLRDAQIDNQLPLFEYLLRRGIVPRHTMNFPGIEGEWMRFAIKSVRENNQFLDVLKEWRA